MLWPIPGTAVVFTACAGGPLLNFARSTTTVLLATIATTVGLVPNAHADAESDTRAASHELAGSPSPASWGLRVSAGVGGARTPSSDAGGFAASLVVEGEYWLTRNIGVGGQIAFQSLSTVSLWCVDNCLSEDMKRVSLAPTIVFRGSNPKSAPILSLALGYSLARSDGSSSCDEAESSCQPPYHWSFSDDRSGLFGSVTAGWLFHGGPMQPGSSALAIGPLIRLDWLTHGSLSDSSYYGWVFTVGLTVGTGVIK
jgi:hypothetical protein